MISVGSFPQLPQFIVGVLLVSLLKGYFDNMVCDSIVRVVFSPFSVEWKAWVLWYCLLMDSWMSLHQHCLSWHLQACPFGEAPFSAALFENSSERAGEKPPVFVCEGSMVSMFGPLQNLTLLWG